MVYSWISSFHEIPSVSYLNPIQLLTKPSTLGVSPPKKYGSIELLVVRSWF